MPRVPAVRADVGQAVGCLREQSLPSVGDAVSSEKRVEA
jgi:hypothetical protein